MKKIGIAVLSVLLSAAPALAASVVNKDGEAQTIIVTEGSSKSELLVGPGETVEFCPGGCFVTFPNGDREALTGSETIEIVGGRGMVK
ncbi:MAG: hypothetical protein ACRECW_00625 [Phyllobacterium sp.]